MVVLKLTPKNTLLKWPRPKQSIHSTRKPLGTYNTAMMDLVILCKNWKQSKLIKSRPNWVYSKTWRLSIEISSQRAGFRIDWPKCNNHWSNRHKTLDISSGWGWEQVYKNILGYKHRGRHKYQIFVPQNLVDRTSSIKHWASWVKK